MSKAFIAVVGPSGSGKSTSLEDLDPSTTRFIDTERKGFPFKGWRKFNIKQVANPKQFDDAVAEAKADDKCELLVIESFTKYAEQVKTLCDTVYKGYDIWSEYAKMIRRTLNNLKNDKFAVAFTAIDEIIMLPQTNGTETAKRAIAIEGKELKKKGIEAEFLIVFFTDVRKDKDGKILYQFETNNDGVTTAKSPKGMFAERFIPNNLKLALDVAKEYFKNE